MSLLTKDTLYTHIKNDNNNNKRKPLPAKQFVPLIDHYRKNAIVTNFFTTFLQTIEVANSYWFASGSTTYITFLLTNNH